MEFYNFSGIKIEVKLLLNVFSLISLKIYYAKDVFLSSEQVPFIKYPPSECL